MLLSKKKLLLLLNHSSIALYTEDGKKDFHEIPQGAKERKQAVVLFLGKTDLPKGEVSIVLGEDAFFQKVFPFEKQEEAQEESDKFFAELPLKPEEMVKKTLMSNNEVYCIATSKEVYEPVAEALIASGWSVSEVVPLTVVTKDNDMFKDDILSFFKTKHNFSIGNLLTDSPITLTKKEAALQQSSEQGKEEVKEDKVENDSSEPNSTTSHEEESSSGKPFEKDQFFFKPDDVNAKKKSSMNFALIIGIIVVLVGVGALLATSHPTSFMGLEKLVARPTPTSVPTPTAMPTPTVAYIQKSDIKIDVQNGTGTPGQAGLVKSALTKAGFTQVSTENAATTGNTTTTMTVAPNVSPTDSASIEAALKNLFTNVTVNTASSNPSYSVVVVTGK